MRLIHCELRWCGSVPETIRYWLWDDDRKTILKSGRVKTINCNKHGGSVERPFAAFCGATKLTISEKRAFSTDDAAHPMDHLADEDSEKHPSSIEDPGFLETTQ
jgi:hypothetical protein